MTCPRSSSATPLLAMMLAFWLEPGAETCSSYMWYAETSGAPPEAKPIAASVKAKSRESETEGMFALARANSFFARSAREMER